MKRMDFTGFIAALFNDWVSKMSGLFSILFAALGFIPHKKFNIFTKPSVQRKIFWGMALFCFFLASVSAWTSEHQNAVSLASQFEKEKENNRPNIVFTQQLYLMFSNINEFKSGSYIFLNLSVKNIGSPSAVYGWHLNIKLPDGTLLLHRIPDMIPNGMKLVDKTSGKIIAQFYPDNQLVEKTIVAIQRGSFISGWLWFKLPNLTQEQLKSSTIILYAQDIMDKEYSMKVDISKNDPNFNTNYFPGSGKNIFK